MARTKQTARSSGGAVRTQGAQRATFQWSSDSDLPTSPISRRRTSPARAAAARASPARANTPQPRDFTQESARERRGREGCLTRRHLLQETRTGEPLFQQNNGIRSQLKLHVRQECQTLELLHRQLQKTTGDVEGGGIMFHHL